MKKLSCCTRKTAKSHTRCNECCSFGSSTWFENALSDNFVEGQKLELCFPDTTEETLKLFLYSLFGKALPPPGECVELRDPEDVWPEQLGYVGLWVFADKHFVPELQNTAMQRLHYLVSGGVYPCIPTIRAAYENIPPGSIVRALMMDVISSGLKEDDYDSKNIGALGDIPECTQELAAT